MHGLNMPPARECLAFCSSVSVWSNFTNFACSEFISNDWPWLWLAKTCMISSDLKVQQIPAQMHVRRSGTRGTVRRQLPLQAGRLGPPRRGKEWLSQYLPGRCQKESKNKWTRAKTPDAKKKAPAGRKVWVRNFTSRYCKGILSTRQNESIVHKCCQALKARLPQEIGPSSLIQHVRKASGAQNHSRRRSSMRRGFCHSCVSTALQGSPSTIAADQNRSFL